MDEENEKSAGDLGSGLTEEDFELAREAEDLPT